LTHPNWAGFFQKAAGRDFFTHTILPFAGFVVTGPTLSSRSFVQHPLPVVFFLTPVHAGLDGCLGASPLESCPGLS